MPPTKRPAAKKRKKRARCGVSEDSGRCKRGGPLTPYKCGVNKDTKRCINKRKPKAKKPGRKPNAWITFLNAAKKTHGWKEGGDWIAFVKKVRKDYQPQQ